MKAIVYRNYGSPDVLKFEETAKPTPKDDEVLIKVRAASVNPYDWHFVRGLPYFIRLFVGLRKPKAIQLGVDVAGEVEEVGKQVTRFRRGDKVFGGCRGAFAEYACATESSLAPMPDNIGFDEAGAVDIAGLTALQALRDKGHVHAGQKILINGASGGVGTFAVQIAKSSGADVTGVCSTRNMDMVRSIGADRVIDYTREDFTRGGKRYDLILECVGNRSFLDCRRVLNRRGIFVGIGGGGPDLRWMIGPLARMVATPVISLFVSQKSAGIVAKQDKDDLAALGELMAAGKLKPIIDRTYSLAEVPEALRYLEQGHARGKVVIMVG
jgi:NADPH:quinone reductase-like Zn-dependent oxidoreductase